VILRNQTIGGDRVAPERADTAPHFPVGPCGAPTGCQVPYQTKAERERARWMTLTETLKHISESEDCDQTTALKELRKVLADGIFRQFVRWADPVSRPFGYSGGLAIPDDTPGWVDWNKARFRLKGDGALLDNWTGYGRTKKGHSRWRTLVFLRQRVEELWPLRVLPSSPDGKLQSDPKVVPFDRKKPGPTPTEQKIVQAAKGLINRGRTPTSCGSWKQFRRELCKALDVDLNERGYGVDTVQKHVRPLLNRESDTERPESTES
jgi:hypothetical protein